MHDSRSRIDSLFLNHSCRDWLASQPGGFIPRYTFSRRLGGLQNLSGHFAEQRNLLPLPDGAAHSPFTILNMPYAHN